MPSWMRVYPPLCARNVFLLGECHGFWAGLVSEVLSKERNGTFGVLRWLKKTLQKQRVCVFWGSNKMSKMSKSKPDSAKIFPSRKWFKNGSGSGGNVRENNVQLKGGRKHGKRDFPEPALISGQKDRQERFVKWKHQINFPEGGVSLGRHPQSFLFFAPMNNWHYWQKLSGRILLAPEWLPVYCATEIIWLPSHSGGSWPQPDGLLGPWKKWWGPSSPMMQMQRNWGQ